MEAYQQFMLAGKVARTPVASPATSNSNNNKLKKRQQDVKQYHFLWQKFRKTVENEWLFYDKELERVLESMLNVRGRLPIEHKMLQTSSEYSMLPSRVDEVWKLHGFRSIRNDVPSCFGYLNVSDVRKSYNHDLLQHEKLFKMLRKFIKKMFDAQTTLTRNFDELIRHHLHFIENVDNEEMILCNSNGDEIVDNATEFYSALSRDLFRKQQLVDSLLEAETFDVAALASTVKDWSSPKKSFINNSKFKKEFSIELN